MKRTIFVSGLLLLVLAIVGFAWSVNVLWGTAGFLELNCWDDMYSIAGCVNLGSPIFGATGIGLMIYGAVKK